MAYERTTVDIERLIRDLLRARLDGVEVLIERDVNTPLKGDVISIAAVTATPMPNGTHRMGAAWVVALSASSRTGVRASELGDQVTDILATSEHETVPGVGFISTVDVLQLSTRQPTSAMGSTFHQFDSQFRVRVRPL